MKLLLQYGANLNAQNTTGRPVLQEARMKRDPSSVRLLLRHGADADIRCYSGACQFTEFHFLNFLTDLNNRKGLASTKLLIWI